MDSQIIQILIAMVIYMEASYIQELLPAFIFSSIVIVVVSLMTPPPSKEIEEDFEAVKVKSEI